MISSVIFNYEWLVVNVVYVAQTVTLFCCSVDVSFLPPFLVVAWPVVT